MTRTRFVLASLALMVALISGSVAHAQNYFLQKAPDGAILITQDAVFGFALPGMHRDSRSRSRNPAAIGWPATSSSRMSTRARS